jgi:hypothetical protein
MDLTGRLRFLLQLYSAPSNFGEADRAQLREHFRRDLEPLLAQYGQEAVIEALDKLSGGPDGPKPSTWLH